MSEGIGQEKAAAIAAAVYAYMACEQEAVAAAMAPRRPREPVRTSPWGASGRGLQMDQRWLLQMRTFR